MTQSRFSQYSNFTIINAVKFDCIVYQKRLKIVVVAFSSDFSGYYQEILQNVCFLQVGFLVQIFVRSFYPVDGRDLIHARF